MKKTLLAAVLVASALASQATVINFQFGPNKVNNGGINGVNEVDPVGTLATGDNFINLPGTRYDDSIGAFGTLILGIGFGQDWGFIDLSSPAKSAHIHGPATTSQSVAVIQPLTINQGANLKSGSITDSWQLPSAAERDNLLAGLDYVNVHSFNFPGGEIRGQLTVVPEPQTYAMIAGLGLLGFACYRRHQAKMA